jgi:hypothetical protein
MGFLTSIHSVDMYQWGERVATADAMNSDSVSLLATNHSCMRAGPVVALSAKDGSALELAAMLHGLRRIFEMGLFCVEVCLLLSFSWYLVLENLGPWIERAIA